MRCTSNEPWPRSNFPFDVPDVPSTGLQGLRCPVNAPMNKAALHSHGCASCVQYHSVPRYHSALITPLDDVRGCSTALALGRAHRYLLSRRADKKAPLSLHATALLSRARKAEDTTHPIGVVGCWRGPYAKLITSGKKSHRLASHEREEVTNSSLVLLKKKLAQLTQYKHGGHASTVGGRRG